MDDWRELYPFESHWLDLPEGRLHYLDEGPRQAGAEPVETLLFVHGNPTWSFHWRELIKSLRGKYRCVAPDHLGCGLSDKPERRQCLDDHIDRLMALLIELDLRNVTLVAQDWGGAIGLGSLLLEYERVGRIVLFNTGAFPPPYFPWRIRVCQTPIVGRIALQGFNAFSRAALRMTLARRKRLEAKIEAGYLAPYDSWGNRRAVYEFVRDIPASGRSKTARSLATIERGLPLFRTCPALLVWGMQDWCFRPECLERFVAVWPDAEVHRIADAGHWVVEDARDEVLSLVGDFLSRTKPQAMDVKHHPLELVDHG